MKFMVNWRVHEDKRHEALKVFAGMSDDDAAAEFGDVNVIGRWHDLVGFTGVAIAETENPASLNAWLIQWNNIVDIEVTPVLDDNEAREFGRKALA